MFNGEYQLAIQKGDIGYFSKVSLEVNFTDKENSVEVIFDEIVFDEVIEKPWKTAVQFGIEYAYEKLQNNEKGIKVNVTEIRGHLVDTTQITIAFSAMYALWNALDFVPDSKPELHENGAFIIPK